MIRLTQNDWRIFRRLQRKHKVSTEFLRYNLENIEKFIWFETWPRIVIRRYAIRKENRVFLIYYRLRRVLFDQSNSKIFKRMRQNIKQWTKRIVAWKKNHFGINEYVEEVVYEDKSLEIAETEAENAEATPSSNEDVIKQMKEQLEILKIGRRPQPLITNLQQKDLNLNVEKEHSEEKSCQGHKELQKSDSNNINNTSNDENSTLAKQQESSDKVDTQAYWQLNLESTPEKQITTQENVRPVKQLDTDEKTEKSHTESSIQQTEKLKTGLNFLDMLMCKVSGSTSNSVKTTLTPPKVKEIQEQIPSTSFNSIKTTLTPPKVNEMQGQIPSTSSNSVKTTLTPPKVKESQKEIPSTSSSKEEGGYQHHNEHSMDSADEFLGFDDCERIPGMLMTPIVPHSTRNGKNSVFVSESLNEFIRLNDLAKYFSRDADRFLLRRKIYARNMEGLMTPKTIPPHFDMPAVPENLLKYRTVAERKQYLQKCSKNYRLGIINNEAIIYRDLQRRIRLQKVKSASQTLAQSANSSMSFTRNGWNAASFINTEFNKYYYQLLDVDHGRYKVHLRGARGNNNEFHKTPYYSRIINPSTECSEYCVDDKIWQYLKPIKTIEEKNKKLNKGTLHSVFKPCPLSHKTFQKPLDDDTAALLLAGGSMAVVRMPTVELEVFPENNKPLHEIAKRYLQYILPHHDISREWAEFSVSTLKQPTTFKEAQEVITNNRKSYTFLVPYVNDRNHILVRRVVDRSEKLDESFEHCIEEKELVPKTDFTFRKNLDLTDETLQICADVVSDMINTVAISCSENSFIKHDPDSLDNKYLTKDKIQQNSKADSVARALVATSPNNAVLCGGNSKKHKKQLSLLNELKRLNATIIDAAVKPENDNKPCYKEYCQMGCICPSLKEAVPMRQHCGKTKCMLECTCKTSTNQSRIMRLETDGRTLTTEDAFRLRSKATARLARMEKEFTSTIVLTENETLLINETNNDKKRRCTKAPKRYEDFTDTEDEQRKNSPKKTAMTAIDKEKDLNIEIKDFYDPVFVEDSIIDQLKHCTVNLVPLPNMDNIAPWCMVHNLYKCFCKGRAIEGKPIIIEKEDVNTTVVHNAEQKLEHDYPASGRAKYTFEKVEKEKVDVIEENKHNNSNITDANDDDELNEDDEEDDNDEESDDDDDHDDDDWAKSKKLKLKENKERKSINSTETTKTVEEDDEETMEYKNPQNTEETQKPKHNLQDVRKRFFLPRIGTCRRHIPTPRRMFLYCNRRRRLQVLKYIKENENERTRLLLNEHIMRSVYYHKNDIAETPKQSNTADVSLENKEKSNLKLNHQTPEAETQPQTDTPKQKFLLVNEVVDLLDDEDDTVMTNISNKTKDDDYSTQSASSSKSINSFEKILPDNDLKDTTKHFQISSSGGVITVKKYSTSSEDKNQQLIPKASTSKNQQIIPKASTPSTTTSSVQKATIEVKEPQAVSSEPTVTELKLPKISSCFSLNVKANLSKSSPILPLNDDQSLDFSSTTSSVNSGTLSQSISQPAKHSSNTLSLENYNSRDSTTSTVIDMNNEYLRDAHNSIINTVNTLVRKKIQDIECALQRESHIIPTPNEDILCIMKWCNFLDAFYEGYAYVWQVKMRNCSFFAVTIQNIMPIIIGAMGIVNITALKVDKLPLMGKMLLQRFRSNGTEKLSVVMQGKQSHWEIKGFLKTDPSTACYKPTPESHPSLTKKINVLCSLLVEQRKKDQRRKEKLLINSLNSAKPSVSQTFASTSQLPVQLTTPPPPPQMTPSPKTPKIAQVLPTRRLATLQTRPSSKNQIMSGVMQLPPPALQNPLTQQLTQQQVDTQAAQRAKNISRKRKADTEQSNNLLKTEKYVTMSSNIEFRSVTQSDIDEIFLPEMHNLDHKWLVLDLHNDFSHIFVPEFRDLVSLDRIQKVINFARQKSKIVKLQFFQNAPFDAFVTPKSIRKIYFGPLNMDMKGPTLILLQSVDGQMMLRELYQLQHHINKKPEETTKAFWLVNVKGQTHFEMDVKLTGEKQTTKRCFTNSPLTQLQQTTETNAAVAAPESLNKTVNEETLQNNENKKEEDEDCVIIETEPATSTGRDIVVPNVLSQTNSLATAPLQSIQQSSIDPKQNIVETQLSTTTLQSLLKVSNANTTIKHVHNSNSATPVILNMPPLPTTSKPLPILTLPPNTIITGINPPVTPLMNITPAQFVNIPQTAVITGIESAPPEAPYSSTIFLTTSPTSATPVASTALAKIGGNTKITTPTAALETKGIPSSEISSASMKQTNKTLRQALEANPIKRRRISLFCSNKFDKASEKLAVDAVIRKILPQNADSIQVNSRRMDNDVTEVTTVPKVVATVGSTQISKISYPETNHIETSSVSTTNKVKTITETTIGSTNAPVVFDVNFIDDGDEPTASIVIKPTSSLLTSSTATITTTAASVTTNSNSLKLKTAAAKTSTTKTSLTTSLSTTSTNICSTSSFSNTIPPPNKSVNLPTVSSSAIPIKNNATVTITPKGKLLNTFLKKATIVPKFSGPISITPKIIPTSTVTNNNVSTPTTSQTSTTTTATSTALPFTFGRTSVTLKVQKIVNPTTTTSTTTTPVSTRRPIATKTLTVQQVQDMLNKSNKTVATNNIITPLTQKVSIIPTTMPVQLIPSIKATIAPAKVSTVSATIATTTSPTIATTTLATIATTTSASIATTIPTAATTASADCVVSTTPATVTPVCTPAIAATSPNPSLIISKVQSFGSTQKTQNSLKNLQTIITSPTQNVASNLTEKVHTPTPPPHTEYGYIVSNQCTTQKFVAKRVAEEFYVKVPSVGILKFQGLTAVNNYLNKYMSKILKETMKNVWQFLVASKDVQVQNHQKSLLLRKTKNKNNMSTTSANIKLNNSLDEPILIDD